MAALCPKGNHPYSEDRSMKFPRELYGKVWHSTSMPRYEMIKAERKIIPNPDLPDSERWGTYLGPDFYPFVRSIGAVSVFDFRFFNVEQYTRNYGLSNWATFAPCHTNLDETVWIEIDTTSLKDSFLSGQAIRELWHETNSTRKFITIIEGAVIGEIPESTFKKVLLYQRDIEKFSQLA